MIVYVSIEGVPICRALEHFAQSDVLAQSVNRVWPLDQKLDCDWLYVKLKLVQYGQIARGEAHSDLPPLLDWELQAFCPGHSRWQALPDDILVPARCASA